MFFYIIFIKYIIFTNIRKAIIMKIHVITGSMERNQHKVLISGSHFFVLKFYLILYLK